MNFAIFNLGYTHTYVAKDASLLKKAGFNFVNLCQFVISGHCISGQGTNIEPYSRASYTEEQRQVAWHGRSQASLLGRVVHIGSLAAFVSLAKYSPQLTYSIVIGMALVKLINNFLIRNELMIDFSQISADKLVLFIKNLADINLQDAKGLTILNYTHVVSNKRTYSVNENWYSSKNLASNFNPKIVEQILTRKPNINLQDDQGWTAVMNAAIFPSSDKLKRILAENPNLNLQNKEGWTALMLAVRNNFFTHYDGSAIEQILAKKSNINLQNKEGWTTLMLAARYNPSAVKQILVKNPNVKLRNKNGQTVLMLAAYIGSADAVKQILEYGDFSNEEKTAVYAQIPKVHKKQSYTPIYFQPDYNRVKDLLKINKIK